MLGNMRSYVEPIVNALLIFPFVAALITLPFMVRNYRRYGGIALMRVIVVYSFVLYSLCAFLLTVLPLPSIEAVRNMPDMAIGYVPLHDLCTGLTKAGFSIDLPASWVSAACWRSFLKSSDLFQILANIAMQVPLGVYLRYYFRRSWKQALLIGLGVSLFYELTQLSGLFFIYPKAYRFASVDDLINNTLGAMIGFWIAPLLTRILPSREEIDRISYEKGQRVTLMRRLAAMAVDWALGSVCLMLLVLVEWRVARSDGLWLALAALTYLAWLMLYFVLLQWLWKGRTIGKALLKLQTVQEAAPEKPAGFGQLLVRCAYLYVLLPLAGFVDMTLVAVTAAAFLTDSSATFRALAGGSCALALGLTLWFLLRCYHKWNVAPHRHYSHSTIVQTGRAVKLPPAPAYSPDVSQG